MSDRIFLRQTPELLKEIPDEPLHLYRAYQLADFDILQFRQTVPKSLLQLNSLSFQKADIKNPQSKIKTLLELKLKPNEKNQHFSYWYIIPYIPQSIGILLGKIFEAPPIILLYLGRIFNLVIVALIIYLAIRIIPVFKWEMVLLATMPMAITQIASNSYDATMIGLAFLLIALILNIKFSHVHGIQKRTLVALFMVSILLAMCRPIYIPMVFLIVLIPLSKFKSKKQYFLLLFLLMLSVFIAPFVVKILRLLIDSSNQYIPMPWLDHNAQIEFILDDPLRFAGILWNTCFISLRTFYLDSFVGILGWLDNPLPKQLINSYLLVLVANAIFTKHKIIKFTFFDRAVLFVVFSGIILATEILYKNHKYLDIIYIICVDPIINKPLLMKM